MKKFLKKFIGLLAAISITIPTVSYAASDLAVGASYYPDYPFGTSDINIGSSNQVTMVGEIEPAIMSVTLPTYIPFTISNAQETENKVISPRIEVKNNSSVPVEIKVNYTSVNLYNIPSIQWSNDGEVGNNGISIGFKSETNKYVTPSTLANAKWLAANEYQNLKLLSLDAHETNALYVVGALGSKVNEPYSSFIVTPTLVVERAYN